MKKIASWRRNSFQLVKKTTASVAILFFGAAAYSQDTQITGAKSGESVACSPFLQLLQQDGSSSCLTDWKGQNHIIEPQGKSVKNTLPRLEFYSLAAPLGGACKPSLFIASNDWGPGGGGVNNLWARMGSSVNDINAKGQCKKSTNCDCQIIVRDGKVVVSREKFDFLGQSLEAGSFKLAVVKNDTVQANPPSIASTTVQVGKPTPQVLPASQATSMASELEAQRIENLRLREKLAQAELARQVQENEKLKAQMAMLSPRKDESLQGEKSRLPDRRRVALVIGNAEYDIAPLANPAKDARDVAAALRQIGFKVIEYDNLTLRQTQDAMREFADEFKKSDVGLVYYSGHGVEAKGVNYLIPVNANIRREYELTGGAYPASQITGMMEEIQASGDRKRVAILILDACRDNPLTRSWRSSGGGLARMDAPAGTFISFATAPGSVASDGSGRNSPFTKHFLQAMKKPNQPIELMFKEIRVGVVQDTKGEQVPWESSSLMGDFYFNKTK